MAVSLICNKKYIRQIRTLVWSQSNYITCIKEFFYIDQAGDRTRDSMDRMLSAFYEWWGTVHVVGTNLYFSINRHHRVANTTWKEFVEGMR